MSAVVEQTVEEQAVVMARITGLVEGLARFREELGGIAVRLGETQAIIDGDDEDAAAAAFPVRKRLRAELAEQTALIATQQAKLANEGNGVLQPLALAASASKKAFAGLLGEALVDDGKRQACHAALDAVLTSQQTLDSTRAALGMEPEKRKRASGSEGTGGTGATVERAPAGTVYVTGEGHLVLRFGPEAGEAVRATLEGVTGGLVKPAKNFKWGEREGSFEYVVSKEHLKAVREAAIKGRDALAADAPKEVRRAFKKLVTQTQHVIDGGATQLAG